MDSKTVRILGIRGLPAAHGGFETFAQYLAFYLLDRGWRVVVYCQVDGDHEMYSDVWEGIERVCISSSDTSLGTIKFDYYSTLDAAKYNDLCLTLGYNTALFSIFLRIKGVCNIINMDGIEWRRAKWGWVAKVWFWLNERFGCWLGNHLIADHPEIFNHLATRVSTEKITMIPYGGREISNPDIYILNEFGVEAQKYLTVIARPEPENSILEIVEAFSRRPRNFKLLVMGRYNVENSYHAKVLSYVSDKIIFVGAIYDQIKLESLRFYSLAYIHGHRVGGTNPSLVEALAAGNPIFAHDNRYNRWVAADAAAYFSSSDDLDRIFSTLTSDSAALEKMGEAARLRVTAELNWPMVLHQYESLLTKFLAR